MASCQLTSATFTFAITAGIGFAAVNITLLPSPVARLMLDDAKVPSRLHCHLDPCAGDHPMRTARRRFEPDPDDVNDPQLMRDRLYSELRNISEQCAKLAHRADLAATKLATLPIRTEGE